MVWFEVVARVLGALMLISVLLWGWIPYRWHDPPRPMPDLKYIRWLLITGLFLLIHPSPGDLGALAEVIKAAF